MKIKKTYIYADSQIIAKHDGNSSDPRYFYLHDRLGSVSEIINTSGSVVKYYTYQPFGETIESGGTFINPFMFSGQFFDDDTSQYYLRARQYDPYLYRFTSIDPAFGKFEEPITLHRYLYCQNDPINRIDPAGLWSKRNHDRIIDVAFGNLSWNWEYMEQIKKGSAYVDSPQFCDAEHAYMHAMVPAKPVIVVGTVGGYSYSTTVLQPLLSKNETVSKMVGFIMSELDQYEYYESLDNSLAYFHLGEASHPLMDWTCPQHDLQLWAGTLPEWVPHIKDIRMSDAEVRETADFTKRSLSQLIQIHDALSGYSW